MDIDSLEGSKHCICFVLPTFNEEANIRECIESIFSHQNQLKHLLIKVLVVDDNSHDKTQEIVLELKKTFSELQMITGQKKGLGDAYKRGFQYALDQIDPEVIFQMDADGQHDPSLIPEFLKFSFSFCKFPSTTNKFKFFIKIISQLYYVRIKFSYRQSSFFLD